VSKYSGHNVFVCESRVAECTKRAEAVARKLAGRVNYDGQSGNAFQRYRVGYIGEDAVSIWLQRYGIAHTHAISFDGKSQPTEIKVRDFKLEVKGLRVDRDSLIVGKDRDLSANAFVIAQSMLNDPAAGHWSIIGWYPGAEVRMAPLNAERFGSRVRELPLPGQHPRELIELLRHHA
jgi:hypothetical protein